MITFLGWRRSWQPFRKQKKTNWIRNEVDEKRKREQKQKEDEERAKGEAAGREVLTNWRNDLNDVNAWMKKSEPKLRREPDDLDLAGLKNEQKQVWVSAAENAFRG